MDEIVASAVLSQSIRCNTTASFEMVTAAKVNILTRGPVDWVSGAFSLQPSDTPIAHSTANEQRGTMIIYDCSASCPYIQ